MLLLTPQVHRKGQKHPVRAAAAAAWPLSAPRAAGTRPNVEPRCDATTPNDTTLETSGRHLPVHAYKAFERNCAVLPQRQAALGDDHDE